MILGQVEIYPYKNYEEPYLKTIHKARRNSVMEAFAHENYIKIFDKKPLDAIISDVLVKLVNETDSRDGFIGLMDVSDNSCTVCYYCVYMEISGIAFRSDKAMIQVELEKNSLLSRCAQINNSVISNNVPNDPRSMAYYQNNEPSGQPKEHPDIQTFLSVPLFIDGKIIGQIGLANAEKYTVKTIEKIYPLAQFCSAFLHVHSNKLVEASKEIQLKKEVSMLKESFIATMSHEIRTPLNGIVGMARLLQERPGFADEKSQKLLRILNECSVQLMELVNDILDFSKMRSGGLILNNHPFDLQICVQNAIDIVQQRISDKGLKLETELPDFPGKVLGDSRRLKQVLINLLNNAAKFTDSGTIKLSSNIKPVFSSDKYIKYLNAEFQIVDTGIGVKKSDQAKIFEVFTKIGRDDQAHINTSPGAGMGLAICKHIVSSMGGEINVHSDGKTGSTFIFNIVLEDDSDIDELIKMNSTELKKKKIIVVDDSEDNRIYLMEILFSWEIQVYCFGSAREALSYMKQDSSFDLAIIDVCMPTMSGAELVQSMREHGYDQGVIGLSSVGTSIPGKEWFDHFAVKPISKSRLFGLVLRSLLQEGHGRRKVSAASIENVETFQILLAEDDYYNQILFVEMLNSMGYDSEQIKIVPNGKLCVEAVEKKRFDIIFMDIKMPVMDGLTATRIIKKKIVDPPPIVAVSASVLDADKNRCYAAGMDAYIPKPIDKDCLQATLKQFNQIYIS